MTHKIHDPVTNEVFDTDMSAESHGNRSVDFSKIHWVKKHDLQKFTSLVEDWDKVLDLWCWYWDASLSVLESWKNIKIYALDVSQLQLDRMKQYISNSLLEENTHSQSLNIDYKKWSMIDLPYDDWYFDKILRKMSLHEVDKYAQFLAMKEVYRTLKKWGLISLREIFHPNEEFQSFFQDTVRKKDDLSWFDTQVKNRYFFTWNEFQKNVKDVGFIIHNEFDINSRFKTRIRLNQELWWDEEKLAEWHQYIRSLIEGKDDEFIKKIEYKDHGDNIEFNILQKKVVQLSK